MQITDFSRGTTRKSKRAIVGIAMLALGIAACQAESDGDDPRPRIKAKADQAVAQVEELAAQGRPPVQAAEKLKQVPPLIRQKKFAEAEALIDEALEILAAIQGASEPAPARTAAAGEFGNPQPVTIRDYNDHAMEPFITRDGKYLLWNNENGPRVNTNLHYAERIDWLTFDYKGEIDGVNTGSLEGVPSVDADGNLFFVSTRDYNKSFSTLHQARFAAGRASAVGLLKGNVSRERAPYLNMDAEISADGQTLYFVANEMEPGKPTPKTSDIGIAHKKGDTFVVADDSERLMANINTAELEYAPAITEDELTLFFTRAEGIIVGSASQGSALRVYVARRDSTDEPFGEPELIEAISGFVEGPTVAQNGTRLYYHKRDGEYFRIYSVTLQ